jgi:chemotaxis signal transduction protein
MNSVSSVSEVESSHRERFILARVERLTLVFPSQLVQEIAIVERDRVLQLPFYDASILGVVHYLGQIIPLISLHHIFNFVTTFNVEKLTIFRLSYLANNLGGVGLVVDETLGTEFKDRLPKNIFTQTENNQEMQLFELTKIQPNLWQYFL